MATIPGPFQWPLLGNFVPFARDPLGYCERMVAEWGDVARFRLMGHRIWMLSHPDDVEQVLVRDAKRMHKDVIYDLLRPMLGDGLVTAEDETWRRHRKLVAPSFTRRRVEGYADAMVQAALDWAARRQPGEALDLHREMMALTQRVVLDTLFGDLGVDTGRIGDTIDVLMEDFVEEAQGLRRLVPKAVATPGRRRTRAAIAELDRTVFALIEARRSRGPGQDLLSQLVAARDEEGGLTDRELRDEAVTAFVAGHETTALALTWTFVLLNENPVALEPLRAELATVLGGRRPTAADTARLPFTTAVVQESLRLLPPVWAIGREVQEDVPIRGSIVPKGDQILLCQWTMHRDPRWFAEPLAFRPERWLADRVPRHAFFPFGGGPRVCVGQHFALIEAVLLLATLAGAGFLRTTGPRPRLMPSITLRPAGPVPATWAP